MLRLDGENGVVTSKKNRQSRPPLLRVATIRNDKGHVADKTVDDAVVLALF